MVKSDRIEISWTYGIEIHKFIHTVEVGLTFSYYKANKLLGVYPTEGKIPAECEKTEIIGHFDANEVYAVKITVFEGNNILGITLPPESSAPLSSGISIHVHSICSQLVRMYCFTVSVSL